ncbi:hypothetical protein HaLaN_17836 [Haematococcus lacustris]|uniref:Uncharacterized protein n=1 Tax=Haematococcus lacustris TaxID=44745 RepID=A0A699ZP38_HAELA|nr:hypothetical protein HaLaN_17836 [Haematococcus lacustris]
MAAYQCNAPVAPCATLQEMSECDVWSEMDIAHMTEAFLEGTRHAEFEAIDQLLAAHYHDMQAAAFHR